MNRPRDRFDSEMTILAMCEELHHRTTHTGNYVADDARTLELVSFLKHTIVNWRWPIDVGLDRTYDNAVRRLIIVTLTKEQSCR